MRIKKTFLVCMTILLVMPPLLVSAADDESTEQNSNKQDGKISAKDEVVYATLDPSGDQKEIYVVNNFEVEKGGTIVDYGDYTNLKNLTDLSKIQQDENTIQFTAPKGKFYYQGSMNNQPLPWDINVSYLLDGEKINPKELAGKGGQLQIKIETSANDQVNSTFYENYLLQISLTLDPSIYSNINATDGMVANAGKNKQVTFTVMPEQDGELLLEADVQNFELNGIDITAVPSSMSIDTPDMDEMTGDIKTLSDAIREVNDGVADLKSGVIELNDGVQSLRNGSAQYESGMIELNRSSSGLIDASVSIGDALKNISSKLSDDSNQMDLSGLKELQEGLTQVSTGLTQSADGLDTLQENYSNAYSALAESIEAIPTLDDKTLKEFNVIMNNSSEEDRAVLEKFKETYSAAQKTKETYSSEKVKKAFGAVNPTLNGNSEGLRTMATNLGNMASQLEDSIKKMGNADPLAPLREGLATLSTNYEDFHAGLVSYTNGVGELTNSYNKLHAGVADLSGGTNELESGVGELHNGTQELHEQTEDLPDQMQEEIDSMISEFENTDFDAVSFVSADNNEKISTVQFVIKTESIEVKEQETTTEQPEEEKGIWDRLKDLFF